jgi:non-specific serine/threonine protein kinase
LVELAPLSEPSLVEQQLATVIGIREAFGIAGAGPRTLTDRLVDHLASRRTLVLLDNCEHLVAACAGLAERLLGACRELTVLDTSREPLGVTGEVTFGVPPLAVPDSPDPAQISNVEAMRLFVDRARLADPNFDLTAENAVAVAIICRRLDGIPLAIELAAARTRSLTPQQLDARLGDRFRLLAGGSPTSLARHQTLRAAIDWSHRLLSGPGQVLFRRLAVFAGGCTLEAAEQVCAEDDDLDVLLLIAALVDKSLLVHDRAQGRYRLLETIRQFAWYKLHEAGELEELRARHRGWSLALAEAAQLMGPAAVAWEARLVAEQDNFRVALEWEGPPGDDGAKRLRLGGALREFWWSQAQPGEGRHWLERALAAAPDAPTAARATALVGAGLIAGEQGDAASAVAYFRQSHALYEQLGDRRGLAEALVGLGQTAVVQGRYQAARRCSSKRWVKLGQREANTWPRSRSTSLATGSTCKAIRPRPGRCSSRSGTASGPSVAGTVPPSSRSRSGSARWRAATSTRPARWSAKGCSWPASWTSGGGSCWGLMGRPCWPPG